MQVDRIWRNIMAKTVKLLDIRYVKRNWSVQVDRIWRNIMAKTVSDTRVLLATSQPNMLVSFSFPIVSTFFQWNTSPQSNRTVSST